MARHGRSFTYRPSIQSRGRILPFGTLIPGQFAEKTTGGVSSDNLAFPSNNVAGNILVVLVSFSNTNEGLTVTDTRSNSWSVRVRRIEGGAGGSELFMATTTNCGGGANTVTVTFTGSTGAIRTMIAEFQGNGALASYDTGNTGAGSSSSPLTGNITTKQAGELLVGGVKQVFNSGITAVDGYTEIVEGTGGNRMQLQYKIAGAAGSYSSSQTITSSDWAAGVVAIRQSSGLAKPIFHRPFRVSYRSY